MRAAAAAPEAAGRRSAAKSGRKASGRVTAALALAACALVAPGPRLAAQASPDELAAACMAEPGFGDTHLAGGVVNEVTGALLVGARIEVFTGPASGTGAIALDLPVATAHSRVDGGYRICNLTNDGGGLLVRASFAGNEGAAVPLAGSGPRIMDLSVSVTRPIAIMGTVVDNATGAPVEGAWVALAGTGFGASTNAEGKFSFVDVPPGGHVLQSSRIGYAIRADSLTLLRNALALRIGLSEAAIAVDPIVVEAPRAPTRDPFLNDPTRKRRGLTAPQMDSIRHRVSDISDILRQANLPIRIKYLYMPGTTIRTGICVESTRSFQRSMDDCQSIAVAVDDMLIGDPASYLDLAPVAHISHFEFLTPLEAGFRFGMNGANGALLLYTRNR